MRIEVGSIVVVTTRLYSGIYNHMGVVERVKDYRRISASSACNILSNKKSSLIDIWTSLMAFKQDGSADVRFTNHPKTLALNYEFIRTATEHEEFLYYINGSRALIDEEDGI